jgi:chorismate mutase/prephenate dehydrogenase
MWPGAKAINELLAVAGQYGSRQAMGNLDELRAQLKNIDERILALIAERQAVGVELGKRKAEAGLPTRDFGQEKVVVERARAIARKSGLSEEVAEKVTLLMIEASLTAQERDRVVKHGGGHGSKALVIGGAGKMGGWMVRFLASQGYEVAIADPRSTPAPYPNLGDWRACGSGYQVIVVAAPLRATREILEAMASAPPRGLVFDVGSLKTPLRSALLTLAEAGAQVTSIHPMFGPNTELLSGRHVIFVDVGVPEATRRARRLFDSTMAVQVEMDLESHDRVIAYVLGLSHALNIAFFTALAESGRSVPQLSEFSSTTFDAQIDVAGQVSAENPHLYFEIQAMNQYGLEPLDALGSAVKAMRCIIENRDEPAFVELMERGRAYLERMERK